MAWNDFNQAVVEQVNVLKLYAISLTKNANDAEDLMQDTVLRAFTYKDKFAQDTNLKAWLLVMMRNIFINNYRKKVAHRETTLNDALPNLKLGKVENQAERNLVYSDMYEAISKLPQSYEETVLMNLEGFQYQEIADKLNVPLGTIKSRMFWARKKLLEYLSEYSEN